MAARSSKINTTPLILSQNFGRRIWRDYFYFISRRAEKLFPEHGRLVEEKQNFQVNMCL